MHYTETRVRANYPSPTKFKGGSGPLRFFRRSMVAPRVVAAFKKALTQ